MEALTTTIDPVEVEYHGMIERGPHVPDEFATIWRVKTPCRGRGTEFIGRIGECQGIHNFSPSGFAWGYMGAGPHQAALAILYDFTGDAEFALRHCAEFCRLVISTFEWRQTCSTPGTKWKLTGLRILHFLESVIAGRKPYEICRDQGGELVVEEVRMFHEFEADIYGANYARNDLYLREQSR